MTSKKHLFSLLMVLFLGLINLNASGQTSCKESYNNALGSYQKGQIEYVNSYLEGCMKDFADENSKQHYLNDPDGKDLVFKVYRLVITSYKDSDKDKLAEQKTDELVAYFAGKMSRQDVEDKLKNTSLEYIR